MPVMLNYADAGDSHFATYRERVPGRRRRFLLQRGRLIVEDSKWFGSEFVTPVPLRQVDPEYSIARIRSQIAGAGALILGAMFGFLFVFGLFEGRPEFFPIGAIIDGSITVICIACGLINIRRIEYYVFRTRIGVVVFDIARAGPDRATFDQFVKNVIKEIEAAMSEPEPANSIPAPESIRDG